MTAYSPSNQQSQAVIARMVYEANFGYELSSSRTRHSYGLILHKREFQDTSSMGIVQENETQDCFAAVKTHIYLDTQSEGACFFARKTTEVKLLENPALEYTNKGEIDKFLVKHPDIVRVVEKARKKIPQYFHDFALRLTLKDVDTQSGDMDHARLVLAIVTGLPPDEAIKALDKLDEDWWFSQHQQMVCRLCLTLDSV